MPNSTYSITPRTICHASFMMEGSLFKKEVFSLSHSVDCCCDCACTFFTQSLRYVSKCILPKIKPPIQPNRMPLTTYNTVACSPKDPKNIATATSFTKGEVMRNASVTPSGMPPFTNPMNSGIDEQEQNGVIAPKTDAKRYCSP